MFRILQLQYILPILQKDNGTVKQQGGETRLFLWGEKKKIIYKKKVLTSYKISVKI